MSERKATERKNILLQRQMEANLRLERQKEKQRHEEMLKKEMVSLK